MCFQGVLFNLRLVAIPMFERHSAMNMFNMLVKFLDALNQPWRAKLIGTSSDGENTMTGRHGGLVTRIVQCAKNNVLRVWCVPHQIDIVVKSSADGINGGAYIKEDCSFSVHLRSQNNLIIAMGVKCPKKTNRWVHLGRVLTFYKKYRRQIIQHTNENHPEKLPTDEWWVITNAVSPAIDEINVTFAKLQSRSLLIVQQEEIVNLLIGTLTGMFGIEVVDPENIGDNEVEYVSIDSMRVDVTNIECHIRDQGSFADDCFDRLDVDEQKAVVKEIATYALILATGLMRVRAERDDNNLALHQDAPPVMLQQLVTLRPAKLLQDVLMPFRDRLKKFWTLEQIEEIEADHQGLHKL
jgi:hypothetical protein